jgi:transmembrane sensor
MADEKLEGAIRRALRDRARMFDTDAAWSRLRQRVASPDLVRRGTRLRLTAMLAAAALILAAGITMARLTADRAGETIQIATVAAERRTVTLEDGSTISLAPRTTLRFRHEGSNRVADLTGQASFTVTHDVSRPFVVRFAGAEAVDIGTEFVVRSFPGDSASVVAVVTGEVALRANAAELRLTAGQAGQVTIAGDVGRLRDAQWVLAWSDGRFLFEDRPLSTVTRELGRWFDADVRVPDSTLARRHVSAVYNTPTLDGVLEALAIATGSRYTRDGRVITFRPARP